MRLMRVSVGSSAERHCFIMLISSALSMSSEPALRVASAKVAGTLMFS